MTPENKEQAKTEIVNYLVSKHPTYPEIDPRHVITEAPNLHKLLIEKQLIDERTVPFDQFQHIIVDQYRTATIMDELNNLFQDIL